MAGFVAPDRGAADEKNFLKKEQAIRFSASL
jgi:hypothetical protein